MGISYASMMGELIFHSPSPVVDLTKKNGDFLAFNAICPGVCGIFSKSSWNPTWRSGPLLRGETNGGLQLERVIQVLVS
jgi:hypothetical protein